MEDQIDLKNVPPIENRPNPTPAQEINPNPPIEVELPPAQEEAVDTPQKPTGEGSHPPIPEAAPEAAPPLHKPGIIYRFFHSIFGADSKVGRVVRPVVRAAAFSVVLFTTGLLAVYLLLYQPEVKLRTSSQLALKNTQLKLAESDLSLQNLQKQYATLQANFQKAQDDQKKTDMHLLLVNTRIKAAEAQIALWNKDGATALQALKDTRTLLDKILVTVKSSSPDRAVLLDNELTSATTNLVPDPNASISFLRLLDSDLVVVEKYLFP
jgi:hypothetical protein